MLELDGRRLLITGGSRGIGAAVARLCGGLGARLALGYARDRASADGLVAELRAGGVEATAHQTDLADPDAARDLVVAALESMGGLDGVVANHGIWKRAPLPTLTPEALGETLAVNLASVLALCRAALPHLAQGSSVVLIASTAGQRGEAEYAHYAATKGGVIALARSLATELAPRGIRVNAVAPGWVLTDMTREALSGANTGPAFARNPLGRPAVAEEIAGPVAFLLSPRSSYLYGEVLSVNGGAVMTG